MRWRLARTVPAVAALACVLAASQGAAANAAVTVGDDFFGPGGVTISVGERVTWTYSSGLSGHTVTADDFSWTSATLSPGQSYQRTFGSAGTFTYHCEVHPSMTGSVTVRAVAATNTPTPRPPTATPTPAPPTPTPTPGVPVGPPAAGLTRSYGPIAPSNGQP